MKDYMSNKMIVAKKLSYLSVAVLSMLISACSQKHVRTELTRVTMPTPMVASGNKAVRVTPLVAGYNYQQDAAAVVHLTRSGIVEQKNLSQDTEKYQKNERNPVHRVVDQAVSTFSIDVDTGSYSNVRRYLQVNKKLPPVDAVRIEEMINYFDYAYAQPQTKQPFAIHSEVVDSPWKPQAKIIKLAIQAKNLAAETLPAAHLVFLVDVSGSMGAKDKLPLVQKTLRLLTEQMRPQDKITLITYASGEKLLLANISGGEKQKIFNAIDQLKAGGATAGEAAIRMAYDAAEQSYIKGGINRIMLATDGDFNVGISDFESLKGMVAEKRKSGVSLTTLGFGMGNYNEAMMEQLADAGDGNYSYIDSEKEAKKVLQRQLSSTLATVAQDVKIQVEFNPQTVKEYRLVGYENRLLKQEDFNNDKVDAGDIGAGHQVTALYEIIPVGQTGWLDESRYTNLTTENQNKTAHEYAYLKLRYKLPGQSNSLLIEQPIKQGGKSVAKASVDTRFALAVASFAQQLQGGEYNASMQWNDILKLAQDSAQPDPHGLRAEFVDLVKTASQLSVKQPQALLKQTTQFTVRD